MKALKYKNSRSAGRASIKLLLLVIVIAALTPFAFYGWKELYTGFLERNPPELTVIDFPRGIGITPVSVRVRLSDLDSGLDEIVVKTHQRGSYSTLLKQQLGGRKQAEINIDFPGEKTALEEGNAILQIKAFDRSVWSNTTEKNYQLIIDFHKPKVEALTTQHNARRGGAQLVFYRVFDEDPASSGVKVGSKTFLGYPARGIDPELTEESLYVVLYAIDIDEPEADLPVRLFAEDRVGNVSSVGFNNKVMPKAQRSMKAGLKEEFLRSTISDLADNNLKRVQNLYAETGGSFNFQSPRRSVPLLMEKFKFVNSTLRDLNNNDLNAQLTRLRLESLIDHEFLQPPGVIVGSFGDKLNFNFAGEELGSLVRKGYVIAPRGSDRQVLAANSGVVIFSDTIGVYGRVLGIDHGLGLVSIYGSLDEVKVEAGQEVRAEQLIGTMGQSGFASSPQLYFEMRVHGVPVDAREWWDKSWYYNHIVQKIIKAQRSVGLLDFSL